MLSYQPRELWPERIYALPELSYSDTTNACYELIDANLGLGRASTPAIHFGDSVVTYKQLAEPSEDLYRSPGFRAFRSGPIKYTAKGRIREGIAENKHR